MWGTVGQWVSGLGTASAAVAGLVYFVLDRRATRRNQAKLIYVSKVSGMHIRVHNRSDRAIAHVKSVPTVMKLTTAIVIGDIEEGALIGQGEYHKYPSHEFYVHIRYLLKLRKKKRSTLTLQKDLEIAPGASEVLAVPEVMQGATEIFITFRDAYGQDWAVNLRTRKLQKAKIRTNRDASIRDHVKARWWVSKHWSKWFWDNYMDHPAGKPPPPF